MCDSCYKVARQIIRVATWDDSEPFTSGNTEAKMREARKSGKPCDYFDMMRIFAKELQNVHLRWQNLSDLQQTQKQLIKDLVREEIVYNGQSFTGTQVPEMMNELRRAFGLFCGDRIKLSESHRPH